MSEKVEVVVAFCGLDLDDKPEHHGTPCVEENCPKRTKYRFDLFSAYCKYKNRDYGPS